MRWRVIVISKRAKLSYKDGYMLVRGDILNTVHLSELGTLVIDSTEVSITSHLLWELTENKTKIIFCDEKHMPNAELIPYYGCHNSTKKILTQINWNKDFQEIIWTEIVRQKIINQSGLLKKIGKEEYKLLEEYVNQIERFDITNREGHAAKVYFNALFGKGFSRDQANKINTSLNYGYSIILSAFTKEITKNGCLTQLGIWHKNEFNPYNLSCDFMEPFRIIVDEFVFENQEFSLTLEHRASLVNLLNRQVNIDNKAYYLSNGIETFVKGAIISIERQDIKYMCQYKFK